MDGLSARVARCDRAALPATGIHATTPPAAGARIALVPQQPDLYTRIHHRIVAAVLDVLPIEGVVA